MAYNQSPNLSQGWGNPGAPPPINTTGGYTAAGTPQQPYLAPQFSPPPPVSPADKNGGSMLKTLNFFSSKPSYTPVSGAGATTLTSPVVGPSGGFFPPQGPGTTGAGPAPPQTTYNTNPIPSYSPSVGAPAGYQPVNPPTQQYPAVPLPGPYNTNQQPIIPGQQQQQPLQHPQTQHPQPQHQQPQPQHQQPQHQQPQHQQPQHQQPQHQQPQHQQPQHQQPQNPQHQQPQHQQPQNLQHQQPQNLQHQQPQDLQYQQPQNSQHQQQNYHQSPPLAHPHPQQYQGSQGFNPTPSSGSPAPPPAYTPPQNGYGPRPEKPTIQSHAANSPAHPTSHPSGQQHNNNTPSASNQHPTTQTSPGPAHNAQNGQLPNQTPQGNAPGPTSGSPAVMNNAEPDAQYWHALVEDSKLPMGPTPTMRSLFRGVAACISKECIVDHSPPCILSPTKMSMYYATLLTYSDRQTKLFSKARTHPSILTDLYNKLNCQYLLIPHPIGDGKRRPPLPALTIDGFEHWMLIQVLLNPDEEYQRLTAFLQAPKRVVIDSATQRPVPTTSIPRSAFPAAPSDWVVKRYAGLLERALDSTAGRAEEIEEVPDIEAARKELSYFKKKSTETQSETHKTQAELVSTRKELDWIRTKLSGMQSKEESARKRLADKDGEMEGLKKRLAETQSELDSSRNEVEGLRRLSSARSGSVSSVSSAGTPPYPTDGGAGIRPPYPVSATPVSPLGPGTPAPGQGAPYYRQQYRPST